jgi:hypothetical protein
MTLYDLLSSLKNDNVKADISGTDGTHICKIFTQGVDALADEHKTCSVISWEIIDRVTINVIIDNSIVSA